MVELSYDRGDNFFGVARYASIPADSQYDSQVGAREFDLDVSLAVNGAGGDQQVRSELERSRDAVLKAINGMRGSV